MTHILQSADELADVLIESMGKTIVLGLPIGIGKAVHVADTRICQGNRPDALERV